MKKTLILLAFALILFSCEEDKSNEADILDLAVTNLSSTDLLLEDIKFDTDKNRIYVFLDNNLSNFNYPVTLTTDVKLSSGAKTSSIINNEISFSSSDEVKQIEVKAENGTLKNWYLFLVHRQLQNSNFESWFDNKGMDSNIYSEIGSSDVSSLWSSANLGTSMYKLYCTQPLADGSNTHAEIKTGETGVVPITAGTLFTGTFDIVKAIGNPTDPKQAVTFGVPFIFKPTAIKFKFKYQAGSQMIQATVNNPSSILSGFTVNNIDGEDKCSIYAILEKRDGDQITELARAEMESGTTVNSMTETTITFYYTSNETPTHITVVFTSSKEGDLWKGAIGSTLVVDDLELIYE